MNIFTKTRPFSASRLMIRWCTTSISGPTALSRYGLGGQSWRKFNPESYQEIIFQALSKKVSYLEVAGQDGGDYAMVGAIQNALERNPQFLSSSVTITARFGYRNLLGGGESTQLEDTIPGDVILVQSEEEKKNVDSMDASYDTPSTVVHNFSANYISQAIQSSPLLELLEMENLNLIFLLHNPEVQVVDLMKQNPQASIEQRQNFIQKRWAPAMETLQKYSATLNGEHSKNVLSFGVCSNGVGIPKKDNHPMYLDVKSIIKAANTYDHFSTVQLPANLLETYGWDMARKIKAKAPSVTNVVAMRPLTCYPDLGTSSKHPFRLVDYALPTLEGENDASIENIRNDSSETSSTEYGIMKNEIYTNEMAGIPVLYQMTLQATMSHFDAEELLEYKQERELTVEERETLDGCKLMQSMIQDLDTQLSKIRSFAAHEEELFGRIIPLIHNTFEGMDDKTSDILQAYFAAYAVAVRYAIAKQTRKVLGEGEDDNNSGKIITYPDIPQLMKLQEYSLRRMLMEKSFDRIVVGASTIPQFCHQTQLMEDIYSSLFSIEEVSDETTKMKNGSTDEVIQV